MKSQEELIYIPRRVAWKASIGGNSLTQLAHAGRRERVEVEQYKDLLVEGWALRRQSGERVLVVSEWTPSNAFQAVLYMPGITSLPTNKEDMVDGWDWIQPKRKKLVDEADSGRFSSSALSSWSDSIAFLEEVHDEETLVKPGLRTPQIGALYAALAHWKVTRDVGTVVMPTGTGKTEVMLALLAKEQPENLLVIVPTAALRYQIADKFLTFGVLQQFGVIGEEAILPVVGRVERRFHGADDVVRFFKSCKERVTVQGTIDPATT